MSQFIEKPKKQQDLNDYHIIDADETHYEAILALNERLVDCLSPLSLEKLESLAALSELVKVVVQSGKVVGFVIVLREGKAYDSVNYCWFSERYPEFLYIDRIAISPEMHGIGVGKAVYRDLFDYAKRTGITSITAEIYSQPPNTASLEFHRANGFVEVGRQLVADGTKEVSLQLKEIL
jgi:uncharacterized protein